MEKKFYLKPETEVLDIMFESELLAGTTTMTGNEDEVNTGTPGTVDPGTTITF